MLKTYKPIHGLDAETELVNILSGEILAEINREVVRDIYVSAVKGAQVNTTTAGIFDLDTDSNGRWSVEKFKGLMFALERDANAVGQQTRRGKGNIIICSIDVCTSDTSNGWSFRLYTCSKQQLKCRRHIYNIRWCYER